MKIKSVVAGSILDSRKEKTIYISIKTNVGDFSASSPTGKSTGKREAKSYMKNIDNDIKAINNFSDYFSEESLEKFEDLRRVEDILDRHVGANTLFALESAILKAMAKEQKKEIWQLINPNASKFPRLVGNCIGGGAHSRSISGKKPDFQEFLLIPYTKNTKEAYEINKKYQDSSELTLKNSDEKFKSSRNDENAWETSLNEKQVLEVLKDFKVPLGLDVAASGFYKRKKYHYENPRLIRSEEEQLGYITNLIKNFDIFYIEDPFYEENYESFAKISKEFPKKLIIGDDLIVTNSKRLEKAIKMKAITGVIVKPNQCGSLIEVKKVCEMANKNKIKIIFSHRSGETQESILADLAFGFGADFLKCGISGKEREVKIKRLIEISKNFK